MLVTEQTTVKELIEMNLGVVGVFEKHGVDVPLECDESILDTELILCESMCHIDDLNALIADLNELIGS